MAKKSGRCVAVENIVGLTEIAERSGASTQAAWNWTRREGFPQPIARVSSRSVWDWEEVDTWNRSWVRSKGGFPTHKSRVSA